MSVYQFTPCIDHATKEETFATWHNGFSDEEIRRIINTCEKLEKISGTIGGQEEEEDISDVRKSEISWVKLNNETGWLYERMAWITKQLNAQFFEFDLYGFVEDFQYTTYYPNGSHYTWHMDKGYAPKAESPRKLSLVLQLTDPSEYEGGDLELFLKPVPTVVKKEKGLVTAFPSWIMHRVTPITQGIRRTLVIWVAGPKFR